MPSAPARSMPTAPWPRYSAATATVSAFASQLAVSGPTHIMQSRMPMSRPGRASQPWRRPARTASTAWRWVIPSRVWSWGAKRISA